MFQQTNTSVKDQERLDIQIHCKCGSPGQGCSPSKHTDLLHHVLEGNRVNQVELPERRLPEGYSQKFFASFYSGGHNEVHTGQSLAGFGPSDTEHSDMLQGMHVQHQQFRNWRMYACGKLDC